MGGVNEIRADPGPTHDRGDVADRLETQSSPRDGEQTYCVQSATKPASDPAVRAVETIPRRTDARSTILPCQRWPPTACQRPTISVSKSKSDEMRVPPQGLGRIVTTAVPVPAADR